MISPKENKIPLYIIWGFPESSVGEESTCNAGDPGSIPESGRSAGAGIGYPFQDSWASLVPQLVKNPSAMWETWVRSLGGEDPLEKGKATHSSILAWRTPWTVYSWGLKDTAERLSLTSPVLFELILKTVVSSNSITQNYTSESESQSVVKKSFSES